MKARPPLIPEAARKKHIAILGMNGSGKTSVAKSQVIEPALAAGDRVCNIDPTGVGWGLRLAADGKKTGFHIYIVGGERADFPLVPRDGKAWAEIVGTSSDSFVFDTSQLTVEGRSQWFTDFAETLVRKNKGPLHLVLDEAHLFAPQAGARAGGIAPKMLHATNNLLALGRSKGLRITMVSQRPAKLHKDALSQAHTLVAMMLMVPHDRDAVSAWIADQADAVHGKEIIASLPTLTPGEGWLWAPAERILDRVKFPLPVTFDSSSAPDVDDTDSPKLAPISPDAINARLASVAKETVANDPKVLRAQIAELNRKLAAVPEAEADPNVVREAAELAFANGVARYQAALVPAFARLENAWEAYANGRTELGAAINEMREVASIALEYKAPPTPPRRLPAPAPPFPLRVRPTPDDPDAPNAALNGFDRPQQRVMDSIAFWTGIGTQQPTRAQVAAVAGYAHNSGNFKNIVGSLNTAGAIRIPKPGLLELAVGHTAEGAFSMSDARTRLESVLESSHLKLTAALRKLGGYATRLDIAVHSGYAADSGNFKNLMGRLRTLDIVDYPMPGTVEWTAWANPIFAHG